MRLLMERRSGDVVRIRLVAYRAGHAVLYTNMASGLTSLGLTSVRDIDHAVRVFDRAVELAEADMLRHPAWKVPVGETARTIVIQEQNS